MASGQGTATIDFGAFPGSNEADIAVTGQGSILVMEMQDEDEIEMLLLM